jgi:hypothetical protein
LEVFIYGRIKEGVKIDILITHTDRLLKDVKLKDGNFINYNPDGKIPEKGTKVNAVQKKKFAKMLKGVKNF